MAQPFLSNHTIKPLTSPSSRLTVLDEFKNFTWKWQSAAGLLLKLFRFEITVENLLHYYTTASADPLTEKSSLVSVDMNNPQHF